MYERLQKRLREMAASEHFISNASDKAAIGEAADRIEQLSLKLASTRHSNQQEGRS